MEEYFLSSLIEKNKTLDPRSDDLKICGSHQKFKVDTGEDIAIISHKAYRNLQNRLPLKPTEGMGTQGNLCCRLVSDTILGSFYSYPTFSFVGLTSWIRRP